MTVKPEQIRQTDEEIRAEFERYSTDFLHKMLGVSTFDPRAVKIARKIIRERKRG